MNRRSLFVPALTLVALVGVAHPALAAWPHDPNIGNVPVCTAASDQYSPTSASDGAGGAIITWYDNRNGNYDIYAQRISAAGVALWTANGVAICTAAGLQGAPVILADGAGGAVISWYDQRGGTDDIYAQRINAAGVTQWTANGVVVSAAASDQYYPEIVSDGTGGSILAWVDTRSGAADVYAQRLNASGVPQWTANGVPVCTATGAQVVSSMLADGSGGAICSWTDSRGGANSDIYAQRINAAGAPQWTANGVAVCAAAGVQGNPASVADGLGGAIICWMDDRSSTDEIYAQRLNAAGVAQWTASGIPVGGPSADEFAPTAIADGVGGAIIAWQDFRNDTEAADLYAQDVNSAGLIQWTGGGVAVSLAGGGEVQQVLTSDGAGGAIIAWSDLRSTATYDIYARRIAANGTPQWAANGVAMSVAPSNQLSSTIVPDGLGGVIVAWADARNGANNDIYAQRIESFGHLGSPEPAISKIKDVPNDQGGSVKVSWDASYLDAAPTYGVSEYRVYRSVPGSIANLTAAKRAAAGATIYWEYVASVTADALAGYSAVVATTSDSLAGSNPRTLFMIEARANASVTSDRWASAPDSGYSVDNLPPVAPAPFVAQFNAGATKLHWNPNSEADLAGYRLYRGTSAEFTPSPATLLAALPDTGFTDLVGANYVYKLTAIDIHGNESPVATVAPSGTLGVPAETATLAFAAPSPNPAHGATTLRFSLSRAGHVRLALYDASGRRVRVLRDGDAAAGQQAAALTLADEAGRALAPGLYLARLEAEGRVLTRRLAIVR